MSQPTYLKNLKAHARRQLGGTGDSPTLAVSNLIGESDRGAVILAATSIEDVLEWAILARLPNLLLDAESRDSVFGHNGSLGTFSSKITMAYAMGVIDKAGRREIDLIREMRNACAHARMPISFEMDVLADIARQVIPELLPHIAKPVDPKWLRHAFVLKCVFLCQYIISGKRADISAEITAAAKARDAKD